eukprot:3243371-Prymnesium_polylepis.1
MALPSLTGPQTESAQAAIGPTSAGFSRANSARASRRWPKSAVRYLARCVKGGRGLLAASRAAGTSARRMLVPPTSPSSSVGSFDTLLWLMCAVGERLEMAGASK